MLQLKEEKIAKVFGLRDYGVDGSFQFGFPALALAPGIPFRIALAFIPAGLYHRQTVFPAQPVTGAPDIGVALPIGIVLAVVHHIHSTENQVIVDVAFVDVGCQHIGVFALQHFVGKLFAAEVFATEQSMPWEDLPPQRYCVPKNSIALAAIFSRKASSPSESSACCFRK